MNSKNVWIGGVIIVALLILGWYLIWGNQSPASQASQTGTAGTVATTTDTGTGATAGSAQEVKGTGTLATAVNQGGNYTCTVTSAGQSNPVTTGTLYSSAGKTRLDFQSAASSGTVTALHIIRNGSVAYEWVEGQTVGTKTAIDTSSPLLPKTTPSGGFILPSTVSWDCHPWFPDQSVFVAPTAISFTAE